MERRFLILHGWQGSGPDHWQTWLAGRLSARSEHVQYPALPDPDRPRLERWGAALHAELERLAAAPGERVVVCHSLGAVLWLREAGRVAAAARPDRVALVAPPCAGAAPPELAGWCETAASPAAVAGAAGSTRVVCGTDDPYCPQTAAACWAGPLGLPADVVPGGAHLNPDAGLGPWPAMEAWALGERPSLV
jgi:predicted alpha/beta hydrolase family esterase